MRRPSPRTIVTGVLGTKGCRITLLSTRFVDRSHEIASLLRVLLDRSPIVHHLGLSLPSRRRREVPLRR